MRRAPILLAAVVLFLACTETPPLPKASVKDIIERSPAFTGSWDPSMLFDGERIPRDPAWRREIISVNAVQVYGTGFTSTARAAFSWRWNAGPFEGSTFESIAGFIHESDGWKLQEEKLRNELWKQERRAE